jgi:hypothetical protein
MLTVPRVLLVGIGKEASVDVLRVRKATHTAISTLRERKYNSAAIYLAANVASRIGGSVAMVDAVTRTAVLSNHTFDKWLDKSKATPSLQSLVLLSTDGPATPLQQAMNNAQVHALLCCCFCVWITSKLLSQ